MTAVSSSARPAWASRRLRSSRSSISAWAPSRWASAVRAESRAFAALPERQQARHRRGREQHAGAGEQRAQAAVGPQLRPAFPFGLGDARVEERALRRVQRVVVRLRPLERGAEPGAAVEVRGIAPRGVPDARGVAEPPVQAQALAVLLEPAAQGRPLADQHLVRDLGGPLAEREQPGVGEAVQQAADGVVRDVLGDELGDRHAAPRVLDPVAELGQPQEDVAQQRGAPRRGPTRRARPPTARRPRSRRRWRGRRRW